MSSSFGHVEIFLRNYMYMHRGYRRRFVSFGEQAGFFFAITGFSGCPETVYQAAFQVNELACIM